MPRSRRPSDWREQLEEAYFEGGEGIGRMLCYNPEREPDVWAWVGGLKIWPRYYLNHFARIWRRENKREWETLRKNRYRKRLRSERDDALMHEARESTRRRFGSNSELAKLKRTRKKNRDRSEDC